MSPEEFSRILEVMAAQSQDIPQIFSCCRCGYCCLHESCPVAMDIFKIAKTDPCPALFFIEGEGAVCMVALENPEIIGVGKGCCIKATCYKNGVAYDFAALPPALKFHVAKRKMLMA